MRRRGAFTLVEMLVAMAIVLVVGAIAYAAYTGVEAKARDNTAVGLVDQVAQNLSHYAALNGGAFPAGLDNNWPGTIASMGPLGEFSLTPPDVFKTAPTDTAGTNFRSYSDTGGSTFQIQFRATGGTGTVYCRDPNGLAILSTWSGSGPWTGCP